MIVSAFFDLLVSVVAGLVGLLPAVAVPSWLSGGGSVVGSLATYAASLGSWVPWTLFGSVVVSVLACLAAGLVIRMFRTVLSLFTGGGGAT